MEGESDFYDFKKIILRWPQNILSGNKNLMHFSGKFFFSNLPKIFFEDVLNLIFLTEYQFNLIIYGTEKIIVVAQVCENIFKKM